MLTSRLYGGRPTTSGRRGRCGPRSAPRSRRSSAASSSSRSRTGRAARRTSRAGSPARCRRRRSMSSKRLTTFSSRTSAAVAGKLAGSGQSTRCQAVRWDDESPGRVERWQELVRDRAEDEPGRAAARSRSRRRSSGRRARREREQRLGRTLGHEHRRRRRPRPRLPAPRAASTIGRPSSSSARVALAPLVTDAPERRLDRVGDHERVAEPARKLDGTLDGTVRARRSRRRRRRWRAHCRPPAAAVAPYRGDAGSTASNGRRPKKRSLPREPPQRRGARGRGAGSPSRSRTARPMPRIVWPEYEFSGSAKSIADLTKR